MTLKVLTAAIAVASIGLASCSGNDAKLAGELAGTWEGTPTSMKCGKDGHHGKGKHHNHGKEGHNGKESDCCGGEMTCAPTITFVKDDGTNGGTLNISAVYTVTKGVDRISLSTPVNATVSGTVTATGTWTVKDDDEVKVKLDPTETVVNVDTASLALNYATLTDMPQDSLTAVKGQIADNIASIVTPMITKHIHKLNEFDDVKVNGNVLIMEMGHKKMTFNKK